MKTHQIVSHWKTRSDPRAAFTRTEILVLVGIIVMLALFQLSAASSWRNQTKIAQCASNLRQLGLTMLLYGNDYGDNLPSEAGSSVNWMWDLEWKAGNTLNQYGIPQPLMYCPGTAPRFGPVDNRNLYNYRPNNFHVIGYAVTLPGNTRILASNVNTTITPQPIQPGSTTVPLASQRVLNAEANLTPDGANFVSVPGGYMRSGRIIPHLSPHLEGYIPAGGNLGMLDGHVEWRSFERMQLRTIKTVEAWFYW